jgi:hypothetical protein
VHREVKQVRALAVALAQLGLTPPLSMHLPRAAAGPEVLVRDDTALVLEVPKKEKSSVASGVCAWTCWLVRGRGEGGVCYELAAMCGSV